MKKHSLIILLLTFSIFGYSQNSEEETTEFFELINSRNIIENVYNGVKKSLKSNEQELFESQDLKYGNKEDIEVFHAFLEEEIDLFIDDTYNEMLYKYSSLPKDSIIKYISIAKENQSQVLKRSGYRKELESIVKKKQVYLINDINQTLNRIRAKYQPLILKVIENGKESDVSKIDLDLFINTNDEENPRFSILNKSNSEIDLPQDFDFGDIQSLTIKYLGKEYIFNRFNNSMPKEVQEMTSPLSEYCFKELEIWTLRIDEKNIILETRVTVRQIRK